jgi:hypothetical protein
MEYARIMIRRFYLLQLVRIQLNSMRQFPDYK